MGGFARLKDVPYRPFHLLDDDGSIKCRCITSPVTCLKEWEVLDKQAVAQLDRVRICTVCASQKPKYGTTAYTARKESLRAENHVNAATRQSQMRLEERGDSWRSKRITVAQEDALKVLGVNDPLMDTWTRGKAHDEIDRAKISKKAAQ